MHIGIIATSLFPPQLFNCHYLQPQLYQLGNLFPKFWEAEISGYMNHFLTSITSIDKTNRTLKLGKSCLGRGEDNQLNYRRGCLQAYNANLQYFYILC